MISTSVSWRCSSIRTIPKVIEQAIKDGIPLSVIEAAQQSPVYKMAMEWKLALPLHPEYRTLPMVWYVPPLSPIQSAADAGESGEATAFCQTSKACVFRYSIWRIC